VFAIHPVHTEVVANGVGRGELYAALAMMAAAIFHLRAVQPERERSNAATADPGRGSHRKRAQRPEGGARPSRRALAFATAMVLYFVGMLFKESVAVLPGLLFLMEWLVLRRGRVAEMLPRMLLYMAYGVPLVIFLVIRGNVIGSAIPAPQEVMVGISDGQRMLYASETLLRYIGQLVIPLHLCAEYSDYTNLIRPAVTDPMVAASLLV
jgi:hypothetical protein